MSSAFSVVTKVYFDEFSEEVYFHRKGTGSPGHERSNAGSRGRA